VRLPDGSPAPAGTAIDAYDPTGLRCGTYQVTIAGEYGPMPVYLDDALTPEHDGALAGDRITFVVNGQPAAPMGPDEPVWTFSGDIWRVNLRVSRVAQQTIILHRGWNLISTRIEPFEPGISSALRNIFGAFTRLLTLDCEQGALSFYPDLPPGLNNLTEVDARHGYWLDASQEVALVVAGVEMPASTPLHLCAGYNLVSYLPGRPLSVVEALRSIDGKYEAVLGFESGIGALSFYTDLPPALNSLREMKPGFGYWIKMKEAATLVYPEP